MDDAPRNASGNRARSGTGYAAAYGAWARDRETWWTDAAEGIAWGKRWDALFDPASGPYGRWFPGAMLNTSFNCLDRHVAAGRGAQDALIWDSPMTGQGRALYLCRADPTRGEDGRGARGPWAWHAATSADLPADGAGGGDRHAGECTAGRDPLGGFGGFAAADAGGAHRRCAAQGDRFGLMRAGTRRVVPYKRCSMRRSRCRRTSGCLPDPAARAKHRPSDPGRDHDLLEAEAKASPPIPVPVAATDPLYILYTSGTTGPAQGHRARQLAGTPSRCGTRCEN